MTSGTKVLLALIGLFVGILVLYYGFLMPSAPGSAGLVIDPALEEVRPPIVAASEPEKKVTARQVKPLPAFETSAIDRVDPSATDGNPADVSMSAPAAARTAGRAASTVAGTLGGATQRPAQPIPVPTRTQVPTVTTTRTTTGTPAKTTPPPAVAGRAPEYTRYVVTDGDTMTSIAEDWFGDHRLWNLIAKVNSVDPNRLKIGQVLRLPPREAGRTRVETRTRSGVHTVRPGDSLSSIAQACYNDRGMWKKLFAANRDIIGSDPDALEVGMKIRVP